MQLNELEKINNANVMDGGLQVARVSAVFKEAYHLLTEMGECRARLKASVYYHQGGAPYPTVGDFVAYRRNPAGESVIEDTLPRKTFFQRFDAFHPGQPQAVAANFDTVMILTSANHDFNENRLRRYLAAARQSGAQYAVVLTKCDAAPNPEEYLSAARAVSGDCPVYPVSARQGAGLEPLRAFLRPGSITVFLGSSGVGKSTLANTLAGREIMDVNGIRQADSKGRHTTARRQLIALENGAMIIDTPGMRELGLMDAEEGVKATFEEIERLAQACRFRDCSHGAEPGCAVQEALRAGRQKPKALEQYLLLRREGQRKSKAEWTDISKRRKALAKQTRAPRKP